MNDLIPLMFLLFIGKVKAISVKFWFNLLVNKVSLSPGLSLGQSINLSSQSLCAGDW